MEQCKCGGYCGYKCKCKVLKCVYCIKKENERNFKSSGISYKTHKLHSFTQKHEQEAQE